MPRVYCSPLTGDAWPDVRPAIGTLAGLANFLNEKRPRRKPPDGHDAAIALATEAAGSFAGIPKIVRTGEVEGRRISDAYWQAKDAKARLTPLVDSDRFLQHHQYWADWRQSIREGDEERARWDLEYVEARAMAQVAGTLPLALRAARLAWYAAALTEKAAANGVEMNDRSYADDAMQGARSELQEAGIPPETSAGVERIWRFVVAAGRMPVPKDDDDLLAAFEAAIMAGEDNFATNLAKHGYGFVNTDENS